MARALAANRCLTTRFVALHLHQGSRVVPGDDGLEVVEMEDRDLDSPELTPPCLAVAGKPGSLAASTAGAQTLPRQALGNSPNFEVEESPPSPVSSTQADPTRASVSGPDTSRKGSARHRWECSMRFRFGSIWTSDAKRSRLAYACNAEIARHRSGYECVFGAV